MAKSDRQPGKSGKRKYPQGIPKEIKDAACTLWEKGRTERAIAALLGISKGAVANAIEGVKAASDGNGEAKALHKKDRQVRELEDICTRLLGGVTKAKIKKAGLTALGTTYGIFFDKIQVLTGNSPDAAKALPALVLEVHTHMAAQRAAIGPQANGPTLAGSGPVIEATVVKTEDPRGGMGG